MNPMELITIDGIQYDPAKIPPHVYQLFDALRKAQAMVTEKQTDLLVANYAVDAISQRVRGAMSVIPPYVPEPETKSGPESPEPEDHEVDED